MRFSTSLLAFSVLASATFIPSAQAQDALSKADVESIVKEYLLENPEVLIESLDNYRTKQEQNERVSAQENIKKNMEFLTGEDAPSIGPADADVVVVEFFDYNCGYCRRAVPDIQKIAESDKNVRFVFREMPILSESSREMALWALAAHKQGKYFEYHVALMEKRGSKTEKQFKDIGKKLGLDPDKLAQDAKSDAVKAMLDKDLEVARDIGIRGTPAFIVSGELFPGYMGEDGLKQAIKKARKN